jgi:phosphoribosyl 1,2-cyclic phosphate phosphodiesterase
VNITLLGTGTSQGVPIIGCKCPVCTSTDPLDQRLRTSALLSDGQTNVLIDSGPDFRQQMLRARVEKLDAIVITHEHNDHVIGIDDVRPFNFSSGQPIKVYALPRVAHDLRYRFQYIFGEPIPGLPRIELIEIDENSVLQIGTITLEAVGIMHGELPILGYKCGDLAYITDMKSILPQELAKLQEIRYLVVNALQIAEHPTHMSLGEALAFVTQVKPEKTWLTHCSHRLGRTTDIAPTLPPNVFLGYDGQEITF